MTQPKTKQISDREAEVIVSAVTSFNEELFFLVKWKGILEAGLFKASETKEKWPHLVIEFYEKYITFCT